MAIPRALEQKVALLWPHLDERARRLFAASEARQLGHGGVSLVSRACGLSRVTITKGVLELEEPPLPAGRVRRPGGGRPGLVARDPDLPSRLEALVEPLTRGDPESPLRWTSKSTRALAAELAAQDHCISHEKVAQLLRQMNYSLQANRKTEEGDDHPDRDAQFLYINHHVRRALAAKRPVISIDAKKKELLGHYHNAGRHSIGGATRPAGRSLTSKWPRSISRLSHSMVSGTISFDPRDMKCCLLTKPNPTRVADGWWARGDLCEHRSRYSSPDNLSTWQTNGGKIALAGPSDQR